MAFSNKPTTDVLNTRGPQSANLMVAWCANEGVGTTLDNVGSGGSSWDGRVLGGNSSWVTDEGGGIKLTAVDYIEEDLVASNVSYPTGTMAIRFIPLVSQTTKGLWTSGETQTTDNALNIVHSLDLGNSLTVTARHRLAGAGTTMSIAATVSHTSGQAHTAVLRWGTNAFELWVDGTASSGNITNGGWTSNENDVITRSAATTPYLGWDQQTTFLGHLWYSVELTDAEIQEIWDDPYISWRPGFATEFAMSSRATPTTISLSVTTDASDPNLLAMRVKYRIPGAPTWVENAKSLLSSGSSTERLISSISGLAENTKYEFMIDYQFDGAGTWHSLGVNRSTNTDNGIVGNFLTSGQLVALFSDSHIQKQVLDSSDPKSVRFLRVMNLIADGGYCACIDIGDDQFMPFNAARWPVDDLASAYSWYTALRNFVRPLTDKVPFYYVLGNHENEGGITQGDLASGYIQSVETPARKVFFLNPEDGEAEPEPTEPVVGTDYTSNVNWVPNITVTPITGTEATDYFDNNIYVDSGAASHTLKLAGNTSPIENYYTFTIGDIQFWALDPFRYTEPGANIDDETEWTLGAAQTAWLTASLAASTAKWKAAICHHLVGGFSAYGRGGTGFVLNPGTEMYGTDGTDGLHALFNDSGMNLFLFGHDHLFHHGQIGGVHYVECGSPATFLNVDWETYGYNGYDHISKNYGFIDLYATNLMLRVRFIKTMETDGTTEANETIHTFTLKSPGNAHGYKSRLLNRHGRRAEAPVDTVDG